MVMRPVWISVYGCLAPAFLRFGGGGYYHYPVLGTELAAVLKARGEASIFIGCAKFRIFFNCSISRPAWSSR